MQLTLKRTLINSSAVIGSLEIDGRFECYTLEDPDGAGDRIPAGTYSVIIDLSTRFKRQMPHIIGSVAINDRGIRIHCGNTQVDTTGCILVGQGHTASALQQSKAAYDLLFVKLSAALARGEDIPFQVLDADENKRTSYIHPQPSTKPQIVTRPGTLQPLYSAIQTFFNLLISTRK